MMVVFYFSFWLEAYLVLSFSSQFFLVTITWCILLLENMSPCGKLRLRSTSTLSLPPLPHPQRRLLVSETSKSQLWKVRPHRPPLPAPRFSFLLPVSVISILTQKHERGEKNESQVNFVSYPQFWQKFNCLWLNSWQLVFGVAWGFIYSPVLLVFSKKN